MVFQVLIKSKLSRIVLNVKLGEQCLNNVSRCSFTANVQQQLRMSVKFVCKHTVVYVNRSHLLDLLYNANLNWNLVIYSVLFY